MTEAFSFGAWVRRRRAELNRTQVELAARAGCATSMLRKIEADLRWPSPQLAARLAAALELPAAQHTVFLRAARGEDVAALLTTVPHGPAPPLPPHAGATAPVLLPNLTGATPMRGRDFHTGGLPPQPTAFVGRDTERMLVRLLLRRDDVRLLTLTGPGGVGKTRLALQVAAELAADFPDGVVFVPLAPVVDPAHLVPAIATACGVPDAGEPPADDLGVGPVLARLAQALRERRLLLLLDNVEHLLPAAPDLAILLGAAPWLTIVATSRAPLHLAWEHDFAVPPLALPPRGMQPSLDQLAQYDAVRLFVARAQAVNATFTLTAENAAAVAEICHRLDGLPLAIELATARCRSFTPQALLARLDNPLALLTGGLRDAPARQQTLRGLIDWSYALLDPPEQRLLARLGVFADGCALDAAEAVCAEPGDGPSDLFNRLLSLVDKSLVQHTHDAAGAGRFVLLETIREYALEHLLASGEQEAVRRAHAAVFTQLAETAAAALEGPEQGRWLDRLEQEHDNLRAALAWAIERQEAAHGVRLAAALRLLWFIRGHLTEGRAWLARLLALPNLVASDRARALDAAGFLARYQGDYAAAADLIGESLALWRDLGHPQGIADCLSNLAYVRLHQGDSLAASELYQESLARNQALGNAQGIADCLSHLGTASFVQSDHASAHACYAEALAIWERLGDREGVAYAQYHLGDVALEQADLRAAARWFAASLVTAAELGWPLAIVSAVEGAAALAARRGAALVAVRLAAFAAHTRQTVRIPLAAERAQLIDRRLAPARQALMPPSFAEAWAAGAALTAAQAIDGARDELAAADHQASGGEPQDDEADEVSRTVDSLTRRELEVARLIAQGHTNRAIADALVVGVKTVEAHTSRILAKLGFGSRAQIAAWAVAHGLVRAEEG